MTEKTEFNAIEMEIFSNRLLAITEDMSNCLIRSSFSTNIKERKDCSVALFDGRGRLIAQAADIPMHLASLMGGVEAVLGRYDPAQIEDGDAFMCNDPYLTGGTHMPDISIITPIFVDGRIAFFTASIGHHSDVGGAVPGSISGSFTTVFQEGLQLPIIRIVRAGKIDEDLLFLVARNTREPEERTYDLKAQIATNLRGGARLLNLVGQMGMDSIEQAIEDILIYTARRLRNRIRSLDKGSYSFTTYLDDDGFDDEKPVPIVATITVAEDELRFDFTGSGPQARGAMNVPSNALNATVYYCVKALLDPGLLPNSGMLEGITISAPPGTILNPVHPAAVGCRAITCQKVAGAIFGAFRGLMVSQDISASHCNGLPAMVFSGQFRRRPGTYVYLETLAGGWGGRFDQDGMDAAQCHISNTSNLPAEALENEYNLIVEEYSVVSDSGGAGRHRGGMGIRRQIRAVNDGVTFSVRSDGHNRGADGVFSGQEGGRATVMRNPGTPNEEKLHSKTANLTLSAGEVIRIETCGGGGYGAPAERPIEELARDLIGGVISEPFARRHYPQKNVDSALALAAKR